MSGEEGEVDLGQDGAVVADDAGKEVFAGGEHAQEVVADLVLDRLGHPAGSPQRTFRHPGQSFGYVPPVVR